MKNAYKFIAGGLVAVSALLVPQQANAFGKGEMSVGLSGGYATYNEGGYFGVNYQWECAPHVRLAPEIGFAFENKGKSAFLLDLDVQFPFQLVRGFGVYPLVGMTFNNWSYHTPEYRDNFTRSRVGADMGVGFDIYFTSFLKMSIQGKYSLMAQTSGGFFGIGMSYVF